MSSFKPDEVLSVKDSIAITETSYNKVSRVAQQFSSPSLEVEKLELTRLFLSLRSFSPVPQRLPFHHAPWTTVPPPSCRRSRAHRMDVEDQLRLGVQNGFDSNARNGNGLEPSSTRWSSCCSLPRSSTSIRGRRSFVSGFVDQGEQFCCDG